MRAKYSGFRDTRNVLVVGVLALLLALIPIAVDRAGADSPHSDSDTVELSTFPSTGTATLHQLDPADVPDDQMLSKVTITATVEGSIDGMLINLSKSKSKTLGASVAAGITVNGPEVSDLTASGSDAFSVTLAPGASAPMNLFGDDTVTVEIIDPDALEAFIGLGDLEYEVSGQVETSVSGPAPYKSTGAGQGSATVTIDYEFADEPIEPAPDISVVKTNDADGDDSFNDSETASAEGAEVPFHLEITNTGNVSLTLTDLVDEFGGATVDLFDGDHGTCDELEGTTLAVGDTVTCEFSLTNYAPAPGTSLENTVTVTGEDDDGTDVTDDDPSTVDTPANPDISIVKTNDADGDDSFNDSETAPAEGATVPFHLEITNTGDVELTLTDLVDEFGGATVDLFDGDHGTCDELEGTTLAVGASVTCEFSLTNYAPAPGTSLENTVTVTGEDADQTQVTDDDPSTVDVPAPECVDTVDIDPEVGDYDLEGGGTFSITSVTPKPGEPGEVIEFTWTSNVLIEEIILKVGNVDQIIPVDPPAMAGTATSTITNNNGVVQAISHIEICAQPLPAP